MAASPPYKVFSRDGEYVASCKYASDAVMIAQAYNYGSRIYYRAKVRRNVVWSHVECSEWQSFDAAAEEILAKVAELCGG